MYIHVLHKYKCFPEFYTTCTCTVTFLLVCNFCTPLTLQNKKKKQSGDAEDEGKEEVSDVEEEKEERGPQNKQRKMDSEEWTDPWARQSRPKQKKKMVKMYNVHVHLVVPYTFTTLSLSLTPGPPPYHASLVPRLLLLHCTSMFLIMQY